MTTYRFTWAELAWIILQAGATVLLTALSNYNPGDDVLAWAALAGITAARQIAAALLVAMGRIATAFGPERGV